MVTDQRRQEVATLHGHPSAIEIIAADYPDWEIRRERSGGVHGDWVAARDGTVLSADTPAGLLVKLEAQELARLQAEYTGRWKVWRTPRYWLATALVDGVTPTLMEETAHALEAKLRAPGPQVGAPYPREAL